MSGLSKTGYKFQAFSVNQSVSSNGRERVNTIWVQRTWGVENGRFLFVKLLSREFLDAVDNDPPSVPLRAILCWPIQIASEVEWGARGSGRRSICLDGVGAMGLPRPQQFLRMPEV